MPPTLARVAILGTGNIAEVCHLPALLAHREQAEVVAVADLDADRAVAFAATWDIPASYGDLATMLAAERLDLVIVCTPPGAHRDAVVRCLDAGVWTWCEKPPTLTLADYDQVAAHEREGGPYASYVFQHRFGSGALRLRDHVRAADLGAPLVGVCHTLWYRGDDYYAVPWRGTWENEGGGPSMGHGIHQMDLALALLGDWAQVTALNATLARDVETEDVAIASVRMESGALLSIVNSVLSPRESSYLRFDFTDATVEVEHLYGYANADWKWTPAPHVEPEKAAFWPASTDVPSSHTAQLSVVLEALRAGRRPPVSGADGRRVLELIAGMYQSAATGRTVERRELTPDNPYYHSMHVAPQELSRA
ncbi:Gfo/Idh/MocA family protein [Herbidospora mongoliensis]|uniref:Gfo/Idh/MocA family protein n=1 Tax=Herbidospora mongoliensis TaxID=688067 RepID=UPI00083797A4|nr:Gfo/Idh/MocA family oxidoreductase [Herbidospora mongoliensis]